MVGVNSPLLLEEVITKMDNPSHRVLENEIKHLQADVSELKVKQDDLIRELSRYKGFFGGVMLAVSAVTALISLGIGYLKTKV